MILSEISVRRPVLASVTSILLVLVGLLAFRNLPVREYPDTDVPAVSITTVYPGASAEVVESRVTEPIEEQISTIDGIRIMKSVSREEVSQITVEFLLERDVDQAANDVRDRVGRARGRLPDEVNEPQISKIDSDANPFIWFAFFSDRYDRTELTDLVDRIAKQRMQTVPGVGNIIIGGERRFAMRVWLQSDLLAAHDLTATDVERALLNQNVDIPGGRIESVTREFTVRTLGDLRTPEQFESLVIATRNGRQIKLADVGSAEMGSEDYRTRTYFQGRPVVGLGVVRQARSNLLQVADGVKELLPLIMSEMPEGIESETAYDASLFVQRSIREVYLTLALAGGLVVLVIFLFLRDLRATLIPLLAIPVSIIGTFFVIGALGFSINLLTLLALVLAVGLVVDDAIVMLENIYRRIEEGEEPVHAALFGSRQVAFAIIATTLTLAAVFLPVAFQSGSVGRLFFEFGITMAVAVLMSSFVALSLTPMLCSKFLVSKKSKDGHIQHGWFYRATEPFFEAVNGLYNRMLAFTLRFPWPVVILAVAFSAVGPWLFTKLQSEIVPLEDRGIMLSIFRGPLGSTPDYTEAYVRGMDEIVRSVPEVRTNFSAIALGRGNPGVGNEGIMFTGLYPWEERDRKTQQIVGELAGRYRDEITGGLSFPIPIRPLGQRGLGRGVQFVLRGTDFDLLQQQAAAIIDEMRASPIFSQPRATPDPNKPQLDVEIDRALAADLGVPVADIATTLETMFGGRQVTFFKRGNREYDVIVRVGDDDRVTPDDLGRIYVRSATGHLIQLGNLVRPREAVTPENYPHFDRLRSVTIESEASPGYTIGDAVDWLEERAAAKLPETITYAWDGETREYVDGSRDVYFLFGLALLFTFLVLAAQFESWIHPLTIYSGVALAISGGIICLYVSRWYYPEPMTDNLFSRFGLIMLIGLVAKNGILIVEFANQLQVQGKAAAEAAYEAACLRFRPILMTSISTVCGAIPIAFATGAGAETRNPMGLVVVGGMSIATVLTLFVVPVFYILFDRVIVSLTGRSSAHGLLRAEEIGRELLPELHSPDGVGREGPDAPGPPHTGDISRK